MSATERIAAVGSATCRPAMSGADPCTGSHICRAERSGVTVALEARPVPPGLAAGTPGPEASIGKLFWARWHRDLGELAMDVLGAAGTLAAAPEYELTEWQRLWLFSRADTIYGGSDQVQCTIVAERVLGLPREPKGVV